MHQTLRIIDENFYLAKNEAREIILSNFNTHSNGF